MRDLESRRFYAAAGGLGAILLGMALAPLRGLTPASNLGFAFMALTIVAAELGGSGAALVTALTSALSLDFFLTQPYLRLSIEDKHDVIAFVGLAACGLIAAGLASQRERRLERLMAVARHRELLGELVDARLPAAAEMLAKHFPLSDVAVRDASGRVLTATQGSQKQAIPETVIDPTGLVSGAARDWSLSLPPEGVRISLRGPEGEVGWLDVWGDGRPASAETRRALSDAARLLALRIAAGGAGLGGARM